MMSYRVCARTTTAEPSRTRITIRLKNEYDYEPRMAQGRDLAAVRSLKSELRAETIR